MSSPDGWQHGTEVPPTIADPVALFRHLEVSRHFHRDTGFGRMFHPGRVSFREHRPTDSLHVIVHGNRVAAHVDRVSPLGVQTRRRPRYSLRATAAHNLVGMAEDLLGFLRGRQGDHRSELDCEWLWDRTHDLPKAGGLLDPESSAWSVQMEAQVSGALDEVRLRDALASVLCRRPFDQEPLRVFECPDDAALERARVEFHRQAAGMSEWPPLRAGLARRPDGDVFLLNVNHAAGDGFATRSLLDTIAQAYATGATPEAAPDFPAVRDLPVRPASASVSVAMAVAHSVVERVRDLLGRPAQLVPDGARGDAAFGFHQVCLSVADTARVVDATRPGTSRNVLLAGLHRAIGEWNLRHGAPARRIGVLVPVDLRPDDWPADRLGNFSVTARVLTSRRHRSDSANALRAVTSQTTRNKRSRTGVALIAALDRSGLLPLWSKQSVVVLQPLTRNRLVDTALLANLGWVGEAPCFGHEAGETVHVWFSLPSRAAQMLCVGAVTVSGQLHLVLRYPHRLFDADAARRFADCLVAELTAPTAGRPQQ